MSDITANEVLCFVANQYDSSDRQTLFSSLCDFYFHEELVTAKSILIAQCEIIGVNEEIKEFKKKRNNTKSIDDLKQKVAKDVLDIWELVDIQKGGKFETTFAAVNIDRLPLTKTNSLNFNTVTKSLSSIQSHLSDQQEKIEVLTNIVQNLCRTITVRSPNEVTIQFH